MPAPIPAGYTRGPILFVGACQHDVAESLLIQYFWEEAGAYGARLVIVPAGDETAPLALKYAEWFTEWESDSVEILKIADRREALRPIHLGAIDRSTGILILGENPVRLAGIIGGTPLAQSIRRANARGKAICGIGGGAQLLCEHMLTFDHRSDRSRQPTLRRHSLQFAPGLGVTNRIVLDAGHCSETGDWARLARLLQAVAYNPFLVGVGLDSDTGIVVYPNNTLEVFGSGSAFIVDGAAMTYTDVHEHTEPGPMSVLGVNVHALGPNFTFDLIERTAHPPQVSDIPDKAVPDRSTM